MTISPSPNTKCLSAAFDTVDHDILINRLQKFVGLSGPVFDWFKTYLSGRDYFVSIGDHSSTNTSTNMWDSSRLHSGTCVVQSLYAATGK